jgi:hypothetical protein
MRVAAIISDLMLFSRIEAAAGSVRRVDRPSDLAPAEPLDLVLVDWSAREPGWADALAALPAERIVLFGRHTDLEAHAAARAAGLGPMWARSKLVAELPTLLAGSA